MRGRSTKRTSRNSKYYKYVPRDQVVQGTTSLQMTYPVMSNDRVTERSPMNPINISK